MIVARAVGGRAALILVTLLACNVRSTEPPALAVAERPEAPRTDVAPVPASPAETTPEVISAPHPSVERVVLITLDGLRWQEVFAGSGVEGAAEGPPLMPNLHRLVGESGTILGGPGCPHDVRASGPNYVSLPGYMELFGGRPPATCRNNKCGQTKATTVLDEVRAKSRAEDVAVFSSWSKYARAVTRTPHSFVVSAGARTANVRHLGDDAVLRAHLDEGAAHAGFPGWGDYRPDEHTKRAALRYLETVRPRLLVVGLGDADDYGHRGDPKGYRRAIGEADAFIADVDRAVSAIDRDGLRRTAIVVTTDHGRERSLRHHGAGFPDSARVFVAAFGAGIARRGPTCAAAPLRLGDVAGVVRTLLDVETDAPGSSLVAEVVAPADDAAGSSARMVAGPSL
ncbi:MAG: hypothetical protein KF894_16575 [Labilithrix sp.]|nr:hypothetical protein [Labilithrix sp.]